MARKSRKEKILTTTEPTQILENKVYRVGVYARISKEDEQNKYDCSIETQVKIIDEFIKDKPYFNIYKV